ncbi:MAG: glycoside hydrolase family 5 protein [Maricaulaceae bacterium]
MRLLSKVCLGSVLLTAAYQPAYADSFETQRCINMGNALDAPREGEWGHTINANSFKAIKEAGFDTVRIPVRWSAYTGGAPNYRIDERFFRRVSQVIDQALANDLQIILNIHHFEELNEAPVKNTAKFLALWDQIASRYKNLPETVYFEVINEPNDKFKGDVMRKIMTQGVEKIRETNPSRILILGGENWSSIRDLPSIPKIDDPNLVHTFHYYDPFEFTHQKTSWTKLKNSGAVNWGSSFDIQKVKADAAYAAQVQRETGRPLFLGEIGAYEKAPYRDIVKYTQETRKAFERAGISWCVWNFTATFPFFDTGRKKWDENKLAALGLRANHHVIKKQSKSYNQKTAPVQTIDDVFNALRNKIGRDGELIMAPYVDQLASYGPAKVKLVSDNGMADAEAIEVKTRKSKNPWDSGLSGPILGTLNRGDTVIMSYWAKSMKGEGVISNAGVQLNGAPYSSVAMQPAKLGSEWQQYFSSGVATRDYGPSEAGYVIQMGAAKQTIRVGPVFIINLGQNVDVNALPRH